jgi:hypothetical protein
VGSLQGFGSNPVVAKYGIEALWALSFCQEGRKALKSSGSEISVMLSKLSTQQGGNEGVMQYLDAVREAART